MTTLAEPRTHADYVKPTASVGLWKLRGFQLDPRRNSLNMIRLVLALAVLYHHTFPLGGFAARPTIAGIQIGGWAVDGFFVISGYLIMASRRAKPLATYMLHRVARIFPAYWVCLIATAAIFAPIAYARQNGGIDGYLTTGGVTPINYVILNASIKIGSFGIGDTLRSVSFPSAWDGSLWTLYYEFSCYLLVGALGIFGWWRRSPLPIAAAFVLSVALAANSALLSPYFGNNPDVANFMELAPFFLGGALIQMLKRRLPLHWLGAAVGLLGIAGALHLSLTWGLQLAAPLLAYVLLWVASIVPSPEVVRHNDISYGVYIYAFPMQQLLATFGMQHHGPILFTLAAMILTLPFATASWLLVEKPIMRRARRADRTGAPALVGATISERER